MSKQSKVKINCQACGKENEITTYASINMLFDNELAVDLVEGKLTSHTCEHCGVPISYSYPILVNTMETPSRFIHYNKDPKVFEKLEENPLVEVLKKTGAWEVRKEVYTDWNEFVDNVKLALKFSGL